MMSSAATPLGAIRGACRPRKTSGRGTRGRVAPAASGGESTLLPTGKSGVEVRWSEGAPGEINLTVTVPKKLVARIYGREVKNFEKTLQFPGFRKGTRPPLSMVEEAGGADLKQSAVMAIMRDTMGEGVKQISNALPQSEKLLKDLKDYTAAFDKEKEYVYTFALALQPKVRLGEGHKSLKVTANKILFDPEAVEETIQQRLRESSVLRVALRALEMGDVAVIDFSSRHILDDGSLGDRVVGADGARYEFDTSVPLLPGFAEALVGAMPGGEAVDADLVFPDNWDVESLRGRKARFTIKVVELFSREIPPLSDAVAGQIAEGTTTVAEARAAVEEYFRDEAERMTESFYEMAIYEALSKTVEVSIPEFMVEDHARNMYAGKMLELQMQGLVDQLTLEELSSDEMVGRYLVSERDVIELKLVTKLAIDAIYETEGLTVSEDEVRAEIESTKAEFDSLGTPYDDDRLAETARSLIKGQVVLNWLKDHTDVTWTEMFARDAGPEPDSRLY